MADVEVLLDAIRDTILTTDQINDVCGIAQAKFQRWISRMECRANRPIALYIAITLYIIAWILMLLSGLCQIVLLLIQ